MVMMVVVAMAVFMIMLMLVIMMATTFLPTVHMSSLSCMQYLDLNKIE